MKKITLKITKLKVNYTSEGSVSYQHAIGIITGYDSHFEESRDYIT